MTNKPQTPGERLREEMAAKGWTQADLALILGRPLPTINEIIAGKRAITAETATQLGTAFGTDPELWMKLEAQYRLSLVHDDESDVLQRAKLFGLGPIREMEKRNWIQPTETVDGLEKELCKFFGVSSLEREPELDALPKKSAIGEPLNPAQKAWGFRAKQIALSVPAKPYDPTSLQPGIARLRELAAYPAETRKVSRVLAKAGIRLVIVEPLPKTRIDGLAFWLNPQAPVIAMSLRYDRIDNFWHVLGHELSHIRHRDSVVMDIDLVGKDRRPTSDLSDVEKRADREAAATWISPDEIESFILRVGPLYSKSRINQFANRLRIHPGIIVGQLQHRGKIDYGSNREMLVKIRETVIAEAITDGWGHSA